MHLIIVSDTKFVPISIFRGVYTAINQNLAEQVVNDVTLYHDGNWHQPFIIGIKQAFRHAEFHHRRVSVPTSTGNDIEWAKLIRNHAYTMERPAYILFIAYEGFSGIAHCALVHSGLLTQPALARDVQPDVDLGIHFLAVDTLNDVHHREIPHNTRWTTK